MREQVQKPENTSHTIQSNSKASKQAPISQILQAYKDRIGGKPVQHQSINEEELLQAKAAQQDYIKSVLQQYKERNIQRYAPEEDEELIQGKFDTTQLEEIDEEEILQGKFESTTTSEHEPVQREEKPNNTGLPNNLKTGIENLSGYSMDDVKVHYNSDKPAQLNALAYAQGTDIHVAPGQEQHLPHEAWHVVQQKQGRVQPTMQLQGVNVNDNEGLEKEADVMGIKSFELSSPNAVQFAENKSIKTIFVNDKINTDTKNNTIQAVFTFIVNTEDYKIYSTNYYRTKGAYMVGNYEGKHITADAVKDKLWTNMEGLEIDVFAQKIINIADEYKELPGIDLVRAHKLYTETEEEDVVFSDDLNEAMIRNYDLFMETWNNLSHHCSNLSPYISCFNNAVDKIDKDASAFHIQNYSLILIENLDRFRDLMPLVNICSGVQKGGREKESKSFLESSKQTKNIKNIRDALWGFFDFQAIEEIYDSPEDEIYNSIKYALPWLDVNKLAPVVANHLRLEPHELNSDNISDAVAGIMIANHIKLIKLSYPKEAEEVLFGSEENINTMLNENKSPGNHELIASYATGGWDWFM